MIFCASMHLLCAVPWLGKITFGNGNRVMKLKLPKYKQNLNSHLANFVYRLISIEKPYRLPWVSYGVSIVSILEKNILLLCCHTVWYSFASILMSSIAWQLTSEVVKGWKKIQKTLHVPQPFPDCCSSWLLLSGFRIPGVVIRWVIQLAIVQESLNGPRYT